jgi:hypothetical protein
VLAGFGWVAGACERCAPRRDYRQIILSPSALTLCLLGLNRQPLQHVYIYLLNISHGNCCSIGRCWQWRLQPAFCMLTPASCFCLLPGRKLRQQGGVCGAFASASATAVSTGGTATAQSQAVAQSICNGLRNNDGTSIAQAISTASSTGNAETVAQAIAEAASGGKTQIAAWLQTLEE